MAIITKEDYYLAYCDLMSEYAVPGVVSYVVIVDPKGDIYTNIDGTSHIKKGRTSDFVNRVILPFVFTQGISRDFCEHGDFLHNQFYLEPEEIIKSEDEDYSVNNIFLNFAFCIMSALYKNCSGPVSSNKLYLIGYSAEAGDSWCMSYTDHSEFVEETKKDFYDMMGETYETYIEKSLSRWERDEAMAPLDRIFDVLKLYDERKNEVK